MKIDLAIMSSTPNPFYLDFWPVVAAMWRDVMGIKPVLLYTPDDGAPVSEEWGEVIRLPKVPGVPPYLHALWSRYWIPQRWPGKVSIISDIDMLPLNRKYFVDELADILDTAHVHLTPTNNRLPSCYHVAKGWKYKEVLELDEDFSRSLYRIMDHMTVEGLAPRPLVFWGSDESYATQKLKTCTNLISPIRGKKRIDRCDWNYDPQNLSDYADSHLLRPYTVHEERILKLDAEVRKHHQVAPVEDKFEPAPIVQSQTTL